MFFLPRLHVTEKMDHLLDDNSRYKDKGRAQLWPVGQLLQIPAPSGKTHPVRRRYSDTWLELLYDSDLRIWLEAFSPHNAV